ncbi:unnamed protein product [Sphagnum troendelagicum]|uniref:Uncharacterized protein n=1 Tax=Sphagnum troendelagicum TaxID=128251 RepID=A0ABP0URS5_9BRYO
MSEDDRIVMHMLPEINTGPAAMGVSPYSGNEEDKADKIATDILPILETTIARTLLDKTVFPSEETKVETVEEEVNPLAREVYIEAYPVDILGYEENLNCLDELPTIETSDMLVRTADIPEGLILAADLEVLYDDRSETEVDD